MKTWLKMAVMLSLFLAFLMAGAGDVSGQQGRGRGGNRPGPGPGGAGPSHQMAVPPDYADDSFSIYAERLPPRYLGQNPETVYNRVVQRKSDDGVYAFQYYPERSYDSKGQAFEIFCELSALREKGRENPAQRSMRIKFVPQMDNRYVITDRTGRRLEIEEVKFEEYLAVFDNFNEFAEERVILPSTRQAMKSLSKKQQSEEIAEGTAYSEAIVGRIQLKPQEAKYLGEAFAVLLIGSPRGPHTSLEMVQRKGTPDRLGQYLSRSHRIHMRLLEIWFYDFEDGRIYLKIKANRGKQEPPLPQ